MGATSFKRSSLEDFNKYNSLLVGNAAFVPPFDPANLNPDLWLDASDASTITESGGSVSQWDNKGTLGNLTQATSADQPTTGVSTLNGLNVLDFDGDVLVAADAASNWKFLHDGTTYFVAVAIKISSASDFTNIALTNNVTADSVGTFIQFDNRSANNSLLNFAVTNGSGRSISTSTQAQNVLTQDAFQIFTSIADPDNGTTADRLEYFTNDSGGTKNQDATGTPSGSDPFKTLNIGRDNATLETSIAEYIIVSGADATEENREKVLDYLNGKWGVF